MTIKTAGDLRGFLAEVLVEIKSGTVDVEKANAISKVAAEINRSIATEVQTALQLQRMDRSGDEPGSLLISSHLTPVWCVQCERRVTANEAATCTSKFCKAQGEQ